MLLTTSAFVRRRLVRSRKTSWFAATSLLCLLGGAVHAAETNTNRAPVQVQVAVPQSVFSTDGVTGKDPFFPNSIRRMKRDDTGKQPTRDLSGLLKLTGVTGGVKPIATINN